MAAIPPAPSLPGEARLEVFVFPGALLPDRTLEEDNKFSDAYRLEFLGKKMSELAYMEVLRNRWPKVTSQQLRPSVPGTHALLRLSSILNIMNIPPQIPELPVEAHLEIFLQWSGHSENLDPHNKFSNGRRLEVLGREMAEVAYLDIMNKRWPRVTAEQLIILINATLHGLMEKAVLAYDWKHRVRVIGNPPREYLDLQSAQESHRLFRTYAGAVYVEHGYDILRDWISALTAL
ncbi:hypothetical protein BD413DRAFT_711192 [Trametes elegans]|nr:hypothetical protein BD413DRAFT_711192 [Trametes elegans]